MKIDLRNFKEEVTQSESDFFTLPKGDTKLRIMTDFFEVKTAWIGEYPDSKPMGIVHDGRPLQSGEKVQVKGWAWAIIRSVNGADIGQMKIVQFPMGLIGKIAKFKNDADYTWDEMPMPFDITISNTGEGGNRYSITPARNNTPIKEEELETLSKKKNIEDIVALIIEKQSGKTEEKASGFVYPESEGEVTAF